MAIVAEKQVRELVRRAENEDLPDAEREKARRKLREIASMTTRFGGRGLAGVETR